MCPTATVFDVQTPISCDEIADSSQMFSRHVCVDGAPADAGIQEGDEVIERHHDPFDYLYGDFNPWCGIDAYRYWYSYTEYATLRGLQKFGSASELLVGLSNFLLAPDADIKQQEVLEEMRTHQ